MQASMLESTAKRQASPLSAHPTSRRANLVLPRTFYKEVFIVLRKQRLIFLHWYHHITVLLYSWYSYKDRVAGGGWFMTMNYLALSLWYSCIVLRAAGVRVPRPYGIISSTCQIAQMVMGMTVSGLVYVWMEEGHCPSSLDNIVLASFMYLSYLLLHFSFFYQAYFKGPQAKGPKGE